jgi:hypothetical protein
MALFGAAYYNKRYLAFVIPILSIWISDLVLNNLVYGAYFGRFVWFHENALFTYTAFAFIACLGMFTLKKVRVPNIIASALCASLIFFLVSNFGVWFSGTITMYPKNFSGLLACYVAGLPFLHNIVLGDLVYAGILFGVFELSAKKAPLLLDKKAS